MGQTATAWFEREDGAKFSWAGPFTMTEDRRRAYLVNSGEMVADLSRRETWPLYPSLKDVRITSLEVVEADGRVSFAWGAHGDEA